MSARGLDGAWRRLGLRGITTGLKDLRRDRMLILECGIRLLLVMFTGSPLRLKDIFLVYWNASTSNLIALEALLVIVFHFLNTVVRFNYSDMAQLRPKLSFPEKADRELLRRSQMCFLGNIGFKSALICLLLEALLLILILLYLLSLCLIVESIDEVLLPRSGHRLRMI
jgi:hypothetical protein